MPGILAVDEIESDIRRGAIDTVITAFPDHLGRLIGKRVLGDYFLDHVLTRPLHACAYLLTVDMEMTPHQGFELTSWEKGYGDFRMIPDLATLRRVDWLEKTAIILCDLEDDACENPIEQAPRSILKKQVAQAEKRGYGFYFGSELEFYLFNDPYSKGYAEGFDRMRPSSDYLIDYHILSSTYDEPVISRIRNSMNASGIPIEFSKGEWGRGQHEINLRYAAPIEMADRHVIYKNGAREIAAAQGKSITFMAKQSSEAAGSSCHIHSSMVNLADGKSLFWDEGTNQPSQTFRYFTGGLLKAEKELCLLFAPTINSYKRFRNGSFAPTSIGWGKDNRTTCLRCVGHDESFRMENRLPGADVNPYLAFAATIAAGLYGIEHKIDCGEPFSGDAYGDARQEKVPRTLDCAMEAFEKSEIAAWAFGETLKKHILHHAEIESEIFQSAVTDWETQRYFERI